MLRLNLPIILCLTLACLAHARTRQANEPYIQKIPGSDISFDMAPIPAGNFLIGSSADSKNRNPDEGPQFEVRVDSFWMGKYVVTWPEYHAFYNNSFRLNKTGRPTIPDDRWADAVTYPTPMYNVALVAELTRMGQDAGHPPVKEPSEAEKQKFWDDPDPATKETIQGQSREMHEILPQEKEAGGK